MDNLLNLYITQRIMNLKIVNSQIKTSHALILFNTCHFIVPYVECTLLLYELLYYPVLCIL